jgi:hypothetical protein
MGNGTIYNLSSRIRLFYASTLGNVFLESWSVEEQAFAYSHTSERYFLF